MNFVIHLTKGAIALVDPCDYDLLSQFSWHLTSAGYAARRSSRKSDHKIILMHRQILGLNFGDRRQCDHINFDRLDNRRSNLRIVTNQQNQIHKRIQSRNRSGFKGVFPWSGGKWKAQISINGKIKYLGLFTTPETAYERYLEAAKERA